MDSIEQSTNHARAGERIPAEPDSIAILRLVPHFFQRFHIHREGQSSRRTARKVDTALAIVGLKKNELGAVSD